jgi:galactosamine-6-phosphate isomerase
MSRAAADHVVEKVKAKPDALLCLATGATPERLYALLVEKHRAARSFFARARFIQLDEWGGLPRDDRATCAAYLRTRLIEPLGVHPRRCVLWESRPPDPARECTRVAEWLKAEGPIDICILGIGRNGHLGLNEPADALEPGAHVTELSASTLAHSMLRAAKGVVQYGLTLGVADIMRAREIVLLVSGAAKAAQLRRAFLNGVTARCPASLLRLHSALSVFCDREAAGLGRDCQPRE